MRTSSSPATESAWPQISNWIDKAANPIEVLPPKPALRDAVLRMLQLDTGSAMGAVTYETGGLLVDRGWIRVLGGPGSGMAGNLANWNGLGTHPLCKPIRGLSVIAHDAAGGVFALDRGALGPGRNGTFYLAPDTLRWVALHRGYSHFLEWICTGDVAGFAGKLQWDGWQADVANAGPDRAFTASPARWTVEGRYPKRANLRAVPMPALFHLELVTARQMHAVKCPTRVG